MDDQSPAPVENQNFKPVKTKKRGGKLLAWLLAILLAVAASGGVYLWQKKEVKDLKNQKNAQAAEIDSLKIALADAEADTADTADTDEPSSSALTVENAKDAIQSGNTAALEGYMASTVRVILAASEGIGDRTPAQAVSDLDYLNSGTDPWNFALPADTLNSWRAGAYGSYVPISAYVGKSANGYVVSFQFNSEGKVSVIFMAANGELMEP